MSSLKGISVSVIFESKSYGKFVISEVVDHLNVKITFLNTGYSYFVQACKVRTGSVKDPYHPFIYGKGYMGEGKYTATVNGKISIEYNRWYGIFERCYDSRVHSKHPTYVGCSVDQQWYNFQVFAEWFNVNKPCVDDLSIFDIDKDIKVKNNKVYSPETCIIVPSNVNNSFSHANKEEILILSPENVVYTVTNVTSFAKSKNLTPTLLWKVIRKERKSHQGWKLPI